MQAQAKSQSQTSKLLRMNLRVDTVLFLLRCLLDCFHLLNNVAADLHQQAASPVPNKSNDAGSGLAGVGVGVGVGVEGGVGVGVGVGTHHNHRNRL
jgi:hypothetical protein